LSEPISKNTAPAIVLGGKFIAEISKEDPVILVVPSDHSIKDTKAFAETVKQGEKLAEQGYIVTFGIKPTYPETGFGYINSVDNRFVEKPDVELAKKYIADGNYYWNSGIFMFKSSTLLRVMWLTCSQMNP
jgi:mannose-1-phosphate guanylyltransferase